MKTATERKKVLADILGLDVWDEYEARAKEQIGSIENELRLIDLRLHEIDAEGARQPQFEAEVATAQKAVIVLGDRLREAEAKIPASAAGAAFVGNARRAVDGSG